MAIKVSHFSLQEYLNNAHMELALISKKNSVLKRGNIFHVKLKMDESLKLKCSIPCIITRIQKSLGLVKVQANTSCKQLKLIEIVSLNSSLVRLGLRLGYLLESGISGLYGFHLS